MTQSNLSALLIETGRSAEALSTLDQAIHRLEAKDGETAPALATLLLRRTDLFRLSGRYQEAEHDLDRALQLAQQNPSVFRQCGVEILAALAANAQELGQFKQAEERFQLAVKAAEVLHGKDSPHYAQIQVNFGAPTA